MAGRQWPTLGFGLSEVVRRGSGKCRGPLVHPRTHLKLMHFDTMWWTAEEDTDERPERVDVESERKFSSGTNRPSMVLSSLQFVFLDDHVIKLTTRELNTWVERCPAALSLTIHSTTYCVLFANWTLFRNSLKWLHWTEEVAEEWGSHQCHCLLLFILYWWEGIAWAPWGKGATKEVTGKYLLTI